MLTTPGLIASVLNADLGALRDVCAELEAAGVDGIQWDVMDGRFVPNLTLGPPVIASCRAAVSVPFEAHLMTTRPEPYLAEYVEAGCELIIVHAEACVHLHRTLEAIRAAGAGAGVALNPATPVESIVHVLDACDLVLVMTVNPGFGGQSYISSMEPKIARVRRALEDRGLDVRLEVDGGIAPATIAGAAAAGADRFVVGSALFRDGPPAAAVQDLRARVVERAARAIA